MEWKGIGWRRRLIHTQEEDATARPPIYYLDAIPSHIHPDMFSPAGLVWPGHKWIEGLETFTVGNGVVCIRLLAD